MTHREAYSKGWRSQGTSADWDDALARFAARYCGCPATRMCSLEHAWADGWSDRQAGRAWGHALDCEADEHETCEVY